MVGRVEEHLVDRGRRRIVGSGVPADVLAGELVAVRVRVELVEHGADVRDVVAEVRPLDHVTTSPASDGGQRRIDDQRCVTGLVTRVLGRGDEGSLSIPAERARRPVRAGPGSGRRGARKRQKRSRRQPDDHHESHRSTTRDRGERERHAPTVAGTRR